MQIVINISEKHYKMVRDGLAYKSGQVLSDAFKNATILPKSHGKLIDADKVLETIENCNRDGLTGIFCSYQDGKRFEQLIKDLPTVLEGSEQKEQRCGKDPTSHDFLTFLYNTINPNEMEQYIRMYQAGDIPTNGENK